MKNIKYAIIFSTIKNLNKKTIRSTERERGYTGERKRPKEMTLPAENQISQTNTKSEHSNHHLFPLYKRNSSTRKIHKEQKAEISSIWICCREKENSSAYINIGTERARGRNQVPMIPTTFRAASAVTIFASTRLLLRICRENLEPEPEREWESERVRECEISWIWRLIFYIAALA